MWIMEIEEEDLAPMGRAGGNFGDGEGEGEVVSAEKRVMVKEILFDMQRREATLRCGTRGVREGEEDARAGEKHIWW